LLLAFNNTVSDCVEWQGAIPLPDLDDAQFQRWNTLLRERTGMFLPQERRSFLTTNIGIRMREIGCSNFADYYSYVTGGPKGAIEWTTLVDRLTVHETRFFRHKNSIKLLLEYFLPDCFEGNRSPDALYIWSVGCATGEEPYTLAMIVDHYIKQRGVSCLLGVTASDISIASLATGRRGIYERRKLTEVDPEILDKYTTRLDDRFYQVNEDIRRRVCFAYLNVMEMEKAPIGKMDIIFCQNLLIYFDHEQRMQIASSLADHLAPDGLLVFGSGELLRWEHPGLMRMPYNDTLAYRKLPVTNHDSLEEVFNQ
jgi:chemotaxis protein methyltransferase CheR/type IV pilus assembly protein PilK